MTVDIADKISDTFGVSLLWLVRGRGASGPPCGSFATICPEIKRSLPVAAAFTDSVERKFFAADFEKRWGILKALFGSKPWPDGADGNQVIQALHFAIDSIVDSLPADGKAKFVALLARHCSQFDLDWRFGDRETPGKVIDPPLEKYLTKAETSVKASSVKAQLPNLLERLNRATKETGKMSALADFLGKAVGYKVPLASVSRWLSGKREPGGEVTLQLLRWVELQERQQ